METKRFADWEEVSCNDCSRYWDNSCDAVSKGSKRLCNSFLATRQTVIPQQIKTLYRAFKWLSVGVILTNVSLILHVIYHWLGWM